MNTRTLCLGALSLGKASGYHIGKQLNEVFGQFVDIASSGVYPALRSLAEEGLVKCEVVEQDGLPNKKIYELTAEGRKTLQEELEVLHPTHKVKSQFMLLLFFAEQISAERMKNIIQERLSEIDSFFEAEPMIRNQVCGSPGQSFLLDYVIHKFETEKQFLESRSCDLLEQLDGSAQLKIGEAS